jgi:hypothetical protein
MPLAITAMHDRQPSAADRVERQKAQAPPQDTWDVRRCAGYGRPRRTDRLLAPSRDRSGGRRNYAAPAPRAGSAYHPRAPMTLTELKYIVAVARERHFGRAAEACFVSQPTLSVAIRKLEDELGVQLFERGNTEISVTPVGLQIVEQAQHVLEQTNTIREIPAGQDPGRTAEGRRHLSVPLPPLVLHADDAPQMPLILQESFTVSCSSPAPGRDRRHPCRSVSGRPGGGLRQRSSSRCHVVTHGPGARRSFPGLRRDDAAAAPGTASGTTC